MKTRLQIEFKIMIHEEEITKILEVDQTKWNDEYVAIIENYLMGRKALQWVLSDLDAITEDDFEKHARWECVCYESGKIF